MTFLWGAKFSQWKVTNFFEATYFFSRLKLTPFFFSPIKYLRRSPHPLIFLKTIAGKCNGWSFLSKVILNCSSFKHGTNVMQFLSWVKRSCNRSSDRLMIDLDTLPTILTAPFPHFSRREEKLALETEA